MTSSRHTNDSNTLRGAASDLLRHSYFQRADKSCAGGLRFKRLRQVHPLHGLLVNETKAKTRSLLASARCGTTGILHLVSSRLVSPSSLIMSCDDSIAVNKQEQEQEEEQEIRSRLNLKSTTSHAMAEFSRRSTKTRPTRPPHTAHCTPHTKKASQTGHAAYLHDELELELEPDAPRAGWCLSAASLRHPKVKRVKTRSRHLADIYIL